MGAQRHYECAYCGEIRPATDDHTPPKSLFVGATNPQLISVKSCSACNTGASDDDEYFRDTVVKYYRVSETPRASRVVEKFLRATANPRKGAYAEAHYRALTGRERTPPSSPDRGPLPEFVVDGERFDRAVRRYVRGLHRKVLRRRVPQEAPILVASDPEQLFAKQQQIIDLFSPAPRRVVAEKVFWFSYAVPSDCPSASAWLLVFFDEFPILAHIRDLTELKRPTG